MLYATDEQLMEEYRCTGNHEPVGALMRRHADKALHVAFHFLRDRSDAQDTVQEAFIRILHNSYQYASGLPFAPWFYRILRNACFDAIRRRNAYKRALDSFVFPEDDGDEPADSRSETIRNAMKQLPHKDRQVLGMRIQGGLSLEEIAAACGCSEEAAKKRAQRGLKRLKTLLERKSYDSGADRISFSETACAH